METDFKFRGKIKNTRVILVSFKQKAHVGRTQTEKKFETLNFYDLELSKFLISFILGLSKLQLIGQNWPTACFFN